MTLPAPTDLLSGLPMGLLLAGLWVSSLWSLAVCFLGYVIYRVIQIVFWGVTGAYLGVLLAGFMRAEPTQMDYFVAIVTCSCVLGIAAWALHRMFISLTIGVGSGMAAGLAMALVHSSAAGWTVGILVGLPLGVCVLLWTRQIIIVLTALSGAMGVVGNLAGALWPGGPAAMTEAMVSGGGWPWFLGGLALAVALAFVGARCQRALAELVSPALMPDGDRPKGKGSLARRTPRRGGSRRATRMEQARRAH